MTRISVATIYLVNGVLVASRNVPCAIRVSLPKKSKRRLALLAVVQREQGRIASDHASIKAPSRKHDPSSYCWERKCRNAYMSLVIRARAGAKGLLRSTRPRGKVRASSSEERISIETDKIRARSKNRLRDPVLMKCISVVRNMQRRCGLAKHECAKAKELRDLLKEQRSVCALTGDSLVYSKMGDNARCDHKIPVSRGGGSKKDNLQWITDEANSAKGTMTNDEFIALCRKVVACADKVKTGSSSEDECNMALAGPGTLF
jgi:hypothetical protein